MRQAFIIMQTGNPDLDKVCEEAIVPALESNELVAKRVDKLNEGGLLNSEIVHFIEVSDIIIADLTNERPNCYLKVGYAMGIDKFRNLILTSRENHILDSPNYSPKGPKIHFDLVGHDILFWHPDDLASFRDELSKRIRRRLTILVPSDETRLAIWDDQWINENRDRALAGITEVGLPGYFEVRYALASLKLSSPQNDLLQAADRAQIETFGWPIGLVLPDLEYRPHSRADGIIAEVIIKDLPILSKMKSSYDYWALRRNGDFYLLKNLFEDDIGGERGEVLFFNSRIARVTEVFLHCARLYTQLGVDPTSEIAIGIKHSGLRGRRLGSSASHRHMSRNPASLEDEIGNIDQFPLSALETRLVDLVKEFTAPLFMLFDYYEFADKVYEDIVNNYVDGRLT